MKSDRTKLLLLTGLGTGWMPIAPGTGASGLAALIWVALRLALGPDRHLWLDLATGAGVIASGIICVAWGPWIIKRTGLNDPGLVTIDEFAGQWLALMWMPAIMDDRLGDPIVIAIVIAAVQFFLFRLLDVIKPGPVRTMERLPAGWGILADDLLAGFFANVVGRIGFGLWVFWKLGINPLQLGG